MKLKHFFRLSNIWKAPISSIVGGVCIVLAFRNIYLNKAVTLDDIALIGIGLTGGAAPDPKNVKQADDHGDLN